MMAKPKSRTSLEPRARQISEPNILTADRFEEHWKCVIGTFVRAGLASRWEPKCKKSRENILKFSVLMMQLNSTRRQNMTWNLDNGDSECSDSMVCHAPLHKQNLKKLQRNTIQIVRCQTDHHNADHLREHKRIHAHDHANLFTKFFAILKACVRISLIEVLLACLMEVEL